MSIILLAAGGTHGDFLHSCGLLMLEKIDFTVNTSGRVINNLSSFKKNNLNTFLDGVKKPSTVEPSFAIELCHIWQEEFKHYKEKFFYIDYTEEQINVIKKMYLEKIHKNNLDTAKRDLVRYLPTKLKVKINKKNFDKVLTLSYKTTIKKYKQQPGIIPIKITDLYNFDSLVLILKNMGILNVDKLKDLKIFHSKWKTKNKQYIKEMFRIENSVSKKHK